MPLFSRRGDRSTRFTVEYGESGFRLTRRAERPKGAPIGDPLDRAPSPDRIWIEARDSSGRPIYRTTLRDPVRQTVEVFDPAGHIARVPRARRSGVFTFVVPDDRRIDAIVVIAGPGASIGPDRAGGPGTTRELLRIAPDQQPQESR
jgi:hypothetical protein